MKKRIDGYVLPQGSDVEIKLPEGARILSASHASNVFGGIQVFVEGPALTEREAQVVDCRTHRLRIVRPFEGFDADGLDYVGTVTMPRGEGTVHVYEFNTRSVNAESWDR